MSVVPGVHRLVPELEARRHLLAGYASFAELPDEVNARWKAPFGPPEAWDLTVVATTVAGPHGPVPVRVTACRCSRPVRVGWPRCATD